MFMGQNRVKQIEITGLSGNMMRKYQMSCNMTGMTRTKLGSYVMFLEKIKMNGKYPG